MLIFLTKKKELSKDFFLNLRFFSLISLILPVIQIEENFILFQTDQ